MSLNKVMLLGNVGGNPEVRTVGTSKVVNISLATTERWTDRNGQKQEKTEWHSLSFFGKLAESAEKYITKGTTLYVEGKLRYTKADDKFYTNITVESYQFVGGKKEDNSVNTATAAPSVPTAENAVEDEDLPF